MVNKISHRSRCHVILLYFIFSFFFYSSQSFPFFLGINSRTKWIAKIANRRFRQQLNIVEVRFGLCPYVLHCRRHTWHTVGVYLIRFTSKTTSETYTEMIHRNQRSKFFLQALFIYFIVQLPTGST